MKLNSNTTVPVYLKTEKNMEWPKDKLFYILSSNGLFLCRNHDWFKSCAPAKKGPGELEAQEPFAEVNFPTIPKALMEKAVGFFRRIEKEKHWEAALILVWNRASRKVELVCPDQKNSSASVNYDIPKLPQYMALIGDIHSHPGFSPTPSFTDKDDEINRPGLHIIVGYIDCSWKPIEFYCCAVVDGQRFEIKNHDAVFEGYQNSDMDEVPQEWLDKVKPLYQSHGGGYQYGEYGEYGGYHIPANQVPSKKDMGIIESILEEYSHHKRCPSAQAVSSRLFSQTREAGFGWCDERAAEFVRNWDKTHETQGA